MFSVAFKKTIVSFETPVSHSETYSRCNVHVAPSSTPKFNVSCADTDTKASKNRKTTEIASHVFKRLHLHIRKVFAPSWFSAYNLQGIIVSLLFYIGFKNVVVYPTTIPCKGMSNHSTCSEWVVSNFQILGKTGKKFSIY